MTNDESALSELGERLAGTDRCLSTSIADILAAAIQELIEVELTERIGAGHGERTPTRLAQRNGHRPKLVSTPAGDVEVAIPMLRQGSSGFWFLGFLRSLPAPSTRSPEGWGALAGGLGLVNTWFGIGSPIVLGFSLVLVLAVVLAVRAPLPQDSLLEAGADAAPREAALRALRAV